MATSGLDRAIAWIRNQQLDCGALPVSSRDRRPYPEVTGYCLPTLCDAKERKMAEGGLAWLLSEQNEEGWWPGPDMMTPYWFDTAMVAGSLLRLTARDRSYEADCRPAVDRAVEWLERDLVPACPPVSTVHHEAGIPGEINLLGLALLSEYPAIRAALDRWLQGPDVAVHAGKMQHFYCYIVEALAEVDRPSAWYYAGRFARIRSLDGSLAAYYDEGPGGRAVPTVSWRCFPAIAQWAALWARLGYRAAAEDVVAYLDAHQTSSGGLTGGDGPYFPDDEITWAAKYYLDASLTLAGQVPCTKGMR